MKPKEYLDYLKDKIYQTQDGAERAHYRAVWEGANEMYKLTHKYFDKYREANRDLLRDKARTYRNNANKKGDDLTK